MILNLVQLHNFMSYADATLDLSGIPVACLTGQNGAGKSALLDAVTWAIFEEARASSDELIRLGESQMWVDLVFAHEGRLYRVRRSRQRSGKAGSRSQTKGNLEFMVADGITGVDDIGKERLASVKWNSLTAASTRETGRLILNLLRMDYDTFINSAYLKQGRSDEFTLKPPSERKQVLGEILGLSYFDRLRDEARDLTKLTKGKLDFLSGSVSNLDSLKDLEVEIKEKLVVEKNELKNAEGAFLDIECRVNELTEKVQNLKMVKVQIDSNDKRLTDACIQLTRLIQERGELIEKVGELKVLLAEGAHLEKELQEFEATRARVEMLDTLQLSMQELSERKIALSGELSFIRSKLEMNLEQLEKEAEQLEKRRQELLLDVDGAEKIEAQYLEYKKMVEQETSLARKQEAFTQLTRRAQELSALIQESRIRLEAEVGQKENVVKDLESVSGSSQNLNQEGEDLDEEAKELDKLEVQFDLCEKRGLSIKSQLESFDLKIEDLKLRQRENLEKIRELNEHANSPLCPLCSHPILDRAAVCDRYLQQNKEMHDEIGRIEVEKERLAFDRDELRKEYTELKRRLLGRKELDKRIGQFNERLSAVSRAQDNLAKQKAELALLTEKLNAENFAQLERESLLKVKEQLAEIDFDPVVYNSLSAQIRLKRHIEARKEQLERDQQELSALEKKRPELLESLKNLKAEISSESYGIEVRQELGRIQESLSLSSYSRDEHARLKQRLSELMHFAQKARDVKRAAEELPLLSGKLQSLEQEENRNREIVEGLENEQIDLKSAYQEMDREKAALDGLLPMLAELRDKRDESSRKVAVLLDKEEAVGRELRAIEDRLKEIETLKEELSDYEFLSEALGKKGIQAVIIENAIPEIESEANRILSRLTENKMHVALITQARTKAGGMSETLDLVIGDELGTRAYELYSGGEAFKVNFALRIALSRLLARRAGSKLETLIIDEGFGSQDDSSRERLVKAIKLIQQEFSRVLIITHISDVKEMFPVQIQVTKRGGISKLHFIA